MINILLQSEVNLIRRGIQAMFDSPAATTVTLAWMTYDDDASGSYGDRPDDEGTVNTRENVKAVFKFLDKKQVRYHDWGDALTGDAVIYLPSTESISGTGNLSMATEAGDRWMVDPDPPPAFYEHAPLLLNGTPTLQRLFGRRRL